MNIFQNTISRVLKDLEQLEVNFALIGALAVGVRGQVRQTVDADFAVALPKEHSAQQLLKKLFSIGYGESNLYEDQRSGQVVMAKLFAPEQHSQLIELDLLFDLCGIEQEVVATAEKIEIWPNIHAPIASPSALLAMKARCQQLPERIQDKADLVNQLIPNSSKQELIEARKLIMLMTQRGYNEGRDILAGFDQLCQEVLQKD